MSESRTQDVAAPAAAVTEVVPIKAITDPYVQGLILEDLRTISYRVAVAMPRMSSWANGKKVPVRAGLFVSRAKTMAAYALALGISPQVALDVVQQLNACDPGRPDYRRFLDAVDVLLLRVAESVDGRCIDEAH